MLEYDRSKRKWILYTRDGSRILGTHKTKEAALRQERAILWSQSKRKNPSAEWFETQRLQNDANGYLINPDTNDIYWYHGAPTGGLFAKNILGEVNNVLYLTSDLDTAVKFACQYVHDNKDLLSDEFGTLDVDKYVKQVGSLPTVLKITLKIPVQQIFDIRNAYSDAKTKKLVKYISEGEWDDPTVAEIIDNRMMYEWFDLTLGYQSTLEGYERDQIFAKQLGFLGWLETEGRDYNIENEAQPCSLGIFTHLQTESYEVVDRIEVTDCSVLFPNKPIHYSRKNPSAEWFETQRLQNDADGYLINPDTGDIYWYHGAPSGDLFSPPPEGHALYLTSSQDTAVKFACQWADEYGLFQNNNYRIDEEAYIEEIGGLPGVLKIVLKIPAQSIFDARNVYSDANTEELAKHLDDMNEDDIFFRKSYGSSMGKIREGRIGYGHFDATLGYRYDEGQSFAKQLGFLGWLETESSSIEAQPCSLGIFTHLQTESYEVVDRIEVTDCSVLFRNNPYTYSRSGFIVNPETDNSVWFHGSREHDNRVLETFEDPLLQKFTYRNAMSFSSDRQFAREFAEDHIEYEMDFGILYEVRIKDVPIFDFTDLASVSELGVSLTPLGKEFVNTIANENRFWKEMAESGEIAKCLVDSNNWELFEDNKEFFNFLKVNDYRGWLESETGHMNVQLLYPHEDVEIIGSEIIKVSFRNNGEVVTKHTLYRGVPYSGLDLDDLEGRGGYGHQMLGGGLYTTDDYYVALNYAQSDPVRYRDSERKDKPCVYELELEIPEDEILYLNAQSINMSFCRSECTSAIPQIFGIRSPAFEFAFKDRNTGEEIWYLISEDEDPLQYDEDFKLECVNEVLSMYGLGVMGRLVDLDEYIEEDLYGCENDDYEDDSHRYACESFEEYVKQAGGDVDEVLERLQKLIDDEIREKSGLPHYGMYNEAPNIFWGGDSTDLANIAANHGYKVLWCSDWVSSGDEIVIVDDSIYDNGLTIIDDCT